MYPPKSLRMLLCTCALVSLLTTTAQAESLAQIRYRLFQDPAAEVEPQLRELASRGDHAAQLLLANHLSGSSSAQRVGEAIELYQRAFDQGHGELAALGRLASVVANNNHYRRRTQAFFQDAVQRYPQLRDFDSLSTTLEVFLVYPEDFQPAQVAELIELYRRACVKDCISLTYRGALAEKQGQPSKAEGYYRRAMLEDPRAVDRYYQILGERQDEVFQAYAKSLSERMDELPLGVVQGIGSLLSGIAGEKENNGALTWLNYAVEHGSVAAMQSKASYMMALATEYDPTDVFALLDRIEAQQPQQGRALRASAYLVRAWQSTLDPYKAYELIRGLLDEGYQNAYLNLGELYSMGGLDEVDQLQAIQAYQQLTEQGVASAFYRIARIYNRGKGICHDKAKAYAYARIAVDYGELGARQLLGELETEISPQELAEAQHAREDILKNVKI
nr:sel1 repeat family protein [uncultured Pseudomonas sp.]